MSVDPQDTEPRVLLAPDELVGFNIGGRYRLDTMLGEGGMGVVYRSHQPGLGRDIAIKLLKPAGVQGAKRLERFQREIAIIAGLSHPNIVRVFDSGVDERLGLHFIAMELVDGVSLDRVLKHHILDAELALEICYQMCGALTEPHAHGIIHRDIKPENTLVQVMSDETIQVKLLDFGIARSHTGDGGRLTTTGVVMGTPRYMAPETVQGGELDARTDLYAIGVILYEMFSGRVPFVGSTPVATMIEHVTKPAPRLDETVLNFKYAGVVELVRGLLEKNPKDRPESARQVRDAIDRIRDDHGFGRLRVRPGAPMVALAPFLRDAPENTVDLFDETADSFDMTAPMRDEEEEGRTDTSMIPVPANVARAHFKEMGWSKQIEVEDEGEATVRGTTPPEVAAVSAPPPPPQDRGNTGVWIGMAVTSVLAIGIYAYMVMRPVAQETVELKPTPAEIGSPAVGNVPTQTVAAPTPEAPKPEVVATQDAGTEDAGDAQVPVKRIHKTKASEKTAERDEPQPAKEVDEVKQGLEWLENK